MSRDPPAEWIARVEDQVRVRGDKGRCGDVGQQNPIVFYQPAFKDAADHAFLAPGLARREQAVGIQAGELRAGAGATRGAVVLLARAENKVATVDSWS